MKKAVAAVLLAGFFVSSYATDARVISMGRHDDFFMDEVSIFRNPANINLYPNLVYGSFGVYRQQPQDTVHRFNNRDPVDPFFGGIVSYSINRDTANSNQYPMFSVGAVFNRRDEMLDYITPGSDKYFGTPTDSLVTPSGKMDVLLGYVLENGGMIGLGGYMAFQSIVQSVPGQRDAVSYETSCYKLSGGINWPVAKSTNLEVSLTGGILRAMGDSAYNADPALRVKRINANNDWFARGDIRFFSALPMLNGDFVPHVGLQEVRLHGDSVSLFDIAGGIGLNLRIDKGFFWTGLEALYKGCSYFNDSTRSGIGGRISFGIERSIWWDWFVIRVGGSKTLMYTSDDSNGTTRNWWDENSPSDGSDNDLVALGFGVNVENRLRVDFVAAEDMPYTFSNLISGSAHHLFTRISATYSF
jgi:hypothetical protein